MTDANSPADQAEVAAFLADPATHGGAGVERIDTHGSMVFMVGDRVYKLKRAVRFPYMDYGTPAKRALACEAEVRLNRRTAPSLYLGMAPVLRGVDGGLTLGPVRDSADNGDAADWVVVMARVDQDTLFDRTMVLYGSNLGNANTHETVNLPTLFAGGGFKHGQHLAFDTHHNYPLPNLFVSMLQRMGIESDKFASSTGTMRGLELV